MLNSEHREPEEIIAEAMAHKPVAIFVGFSGGDDSLVVAHWMMNNVPGCQAFHANTGIGIEATRQFVRDTCRDNGWPLTEIRAKEDCGQDYRQIVLEHGFPGPPMHNRMYRRLKERCVRKLVKGVKTARMDRVIIATGVRHDESLIRMGYGNATSNREGAQVWISPLYWWTKEKFIAYRNHHKLKRNPVAETLGMSGECLCGAFAHKGEKALIRIVDPATADYLDTLELEVRAKGHDWGWEECPPRKTPRRTSYDPKARPMCFSCEKGEVEDA